MIKSTLKTFLQVSFALLVIKSAWIIYEVVQGYRQYEVTSFSERMQSDYF